MTEPEIALDAAIRALASARREERESAAATIFRIACDSAEPFVRLWTKDTEFAQLVGAPAPEFTAGVAVEPELFPAIRSANGSPRLASVPPEQNALEFHLRFDVEVKTDVRLEILTARDSSGDGAVARYLGKFGAGIQHIEIATSNVDRATQILKSKFELEPIYPAARPGADGARINFFLVTNPAGRKLLVELEEEPKRP
jgi:hypothetical protein